MQNSSLGEVPYINNDDGDDPSDDYDHKSDLPA